VHVGSFRWSWDEESIVNGVLIILINQGQTHHSSPLPPILCRTFTGGLRHHLPCPDSAVLQGQHKNRPGKAARPSVLSLVNIPPPTAPARSRSFTMVAFSSIFAVGTLITSTLATPLHFSELDRRALPIGISASTARSYLSERESAHNP